MNHEEMIAHVMEYIAAEEKDAEKYEKLAESHPEYKCIFRDMAKDERSHARMLRHVIDH